MYDQSTLSETMNLLIAEGYTEDFNLRQNNLEARNSNFNLFHDEFQVDKFYRFDGLTNPSDESILYAISSKKYGIKGLLVNGYGTYADGMTSEMMKSLAFR